MFWGRDVMFISLIAQLFFMTRDSYEAAGRLSSHRFSFMWASCGPAPQRLLPGGSGGAPGGPSQLFVHSVTEAVNGFNMRYSAERSGS